MEPAAKGPVGVAFGRFLLLPHRRELLADGQAIDLGARAFDVLMALIEARGAVVGKNALAARVWPGQIVQDAALQSQVSALRAALGADRDLIRTVSGRGYQFVGEIRDDPAPRADGDGERAATPQPRASVPPTNLTEPVSELIGRDKELREIEDLAASHRLVTLTGAGGIGKTRLAMAVARRLMPRFGDGVWAVDFSSVSDPSLVPATIAVAVGLDPGGTAARQHVARALAVQRLLLVLDTCEHVVGAVAAMAEELLRAGAAAHVIATSREPLRAEGEWIYPVLPLAVPAEDARDDDLPQYGAVRLFVERARAVEPHFAPDPQDTAAIAAICRQLDGIPLAIELAAARTGALSVEQIVAHLDDRFHLLTGGRRTALPRHQTLRATLDWSYELLLEPERVMLRRLGVFRGVFSLEAARAVAAGPEIAAAQVVHGLSDLVAKSLVVTQIDHVAHYRLLDTTRAYALEKLTESGESERVARRHATYYLELLEAAGRDPAREDERYGAVEPELGNLRAALAWAFGPEGDQTIGVKLAAVSLPLWFSMSSLGEAHAWTEGAIQRLDEAGLFGSHQEMVLQAARGISLQMVSAGTSEASAALRRALALAEQFRDAGFQMHVVHSLWIYHMRIGEVRTALDLVRRSEAIAASMTASDASATVEWMLGIALHFSGEHRSARLHLEHLLFSSPSSARRRQIRRAGFDQYTTTRYILAHVLWVQGYPDQAAEAVQISVEEARRLEHPVTLCSVLAWGACALALRVGNLDEAWRSAKELVHYAEKHALADHVSYGLAAQEIIALRRAGANVGVQQVRTVFDRWRASQWHLFLSVGDFAEAAAAVGLAGETVAILDEALRRAERNQELWAYPEMLRVKGELLLLKEVPDTRGARHCFWRSIEQARAQGALAWQLRSAASLHRLDLRGGDAGESRELLSHVYGQFSEGFHTADLQAARRLLAEYRGWVPG